MVYIGSSDSDQFDQELEDIEVPVDSSGEFTFKIGVKAPDLFKLPSVEDIFDATAVCLIVYYDEREFFRCSFLVSHEYENQSFPEQFTEVGLLRYVRFRQVDLHARAAENIHQRQLQLGRVRLADEVHERPAGRVQEPRASE